VIQTVTAADKDLSPAGQRFSFRLSAEASNKPNFTVHDYRSKLLTCTSLSEQQDVLIMTKMITLYYSHVYRHFYLTFLIIKLSRTYNNINSGLTPFLIFRGQELSEHQRLRFPYRPAKTATCFIFFLLSFSISGRTQMSRQVYF